MAVQALFGGSFDPVHNGHLAVARQVVKLFNVDKLWFIPASVSPLKRGSMTASDADRIQMLKLAIGDDCHFGIDDCELLRGGVSYTIDTLRYWKSRYPDDEIVFVAGMDSLLSLSKWKDYLDIAHICRFVTFLRPGCDFAPRVEDLSLPVELAKRLLADVFEGELNDISSTEIRRLASEGKDIGDLVPRAVAGYIKEMSLYAVS